MPYILTRPTVVGCSYQIHDLFLIGDSSYTRKQFRRSNFQKLHTYLRVRTLNFSIGQYAPRNDLNSDIGKTVKESFWSSPGRTRLETENFCKWFVNSDRPILQSSQTGFGDIQGSGGFRPVVELERNLRQWSPTGGSLENVDGLQKILNITCKFILLTFQRVLIVKSLCTKVTK